MSDINADNVQIITQTTDTSTGDLVVTVDGVETQRIARPEVLHDIQIRAAFTAAMTRADQIKTQMDTIQATTLDTVGKCSTAIKTCSEAIEDLTTAVKRLIRLIDNRLDAAD